jgi:16S rRNA (uracil1498-N3)-methyltransferase
MRLYLLPKEFSGEPLLRLDGKEAHYLTKVLRMKEGSRFAGRDHKGRLWDLEVTHKDRNTCSLSCSLAGEGVLETSDALPAYAGPFVDISLYQCLCKGKKMEQIVRQATELGTTRIIPVQSANSVVDLSKKEIDELTEKKDRLQAMVKEAIQQSGSTIPTTIERTIPLSQVIADWKGRGLGLFFHQLPISEQQSLASIVATYAKKNGSTAPIAVLIGPEGGLSEDEVQILLQAGFKPILLKTNILRAETAAIYALSVIQVVMLE